MREEDALIWGQLDISIKLVNCRNQAILDLNIGIFYVEDSLSLYFHDEHKGKTYLIQRSVKVNATLSRSFFPFRLNTGYVGCQRE